MTEKSRGGLLRRPKPTSFCRASEIERNKDEEMNRGGYQSMKEIRKWWCEMVYQYQMNENDKLYEIT